MAFATITVNPKPTTRQRQSDHAGATRHNAAIIAELPAWFRRDGWNRR
jgi:hypothetical protein